MSLEGKYGKFFIQKTYKKWRVPMGTSKKYQQKINENFPIHFKP